MFKDKLKHLRLEKNVTQADVANAIGVSAATIGNYEQGTRQPKNHKLWKKLADYFEVSVDDLMEQDNSHDEKSTEKAETTPSSIRDWTRQYRTDIPIIYNNVDITDLVRSNERDKKIITMEQRYAYTEYVSRSGHVLYARRNLLDILNELKFRPACEISENLPNIVEQIESYIVYWYKKCWNNIDDLFPVANSIATLYDLLDKCICVDLVAAQEFSLIPLNENFDWLREKLR